MTPADIEAWWYHAGTATGCWPFARAFSGPFALPIDQSLKDLPDRAFFKKHCQIVLTIMPEVRGGTGSHQTPALVHPCVPTCGPSEPASLCPLAGASGRPLAVQLPPSTQPASTATWASHECFCALPIRTGQLEGPLVVDLANYLLLHRLVPRPVLCNFEIPYGVAVNGMDLCNIRPPLKVSCKINLPCLVQAVPHLAGLCAREQVLACRNMLANEDLQCFIEARYARNSLPSLQLPNPAFPCVPEPSCVLGWAPDFCTGCADAFKWSFLQRTSLGCFPCTAHCETRLLSVALSAGQDLLYMTVRQILESVQSFLSDNASVPTDQAKGLLLTFHRIRSLHSDCCRPGAKLPCRPLSACLTGVPASLLEVDRPDRIGLSVAAQLLSPRSLRLHHVNTGPYKCLLPAPASLILPGTQATLRERLFLLLVHECTRSFPDLGKYFVTFQVRKAVLGQLCLPSQVTPCLLEGCWRLASAAAGVWPNARVYSGPFPLEFFKPLRAQEDRFFVKASMGICITVVPEVRGGGAKDENLQLAVSRFASTCLERGISLDNASAASQALVQRAGAKACLNAFQSGDANATWGALQTLAQLHSVEWPAGDNRTEKAAKRIQRAIRRKKLQTSLTASASAFRLDPSVWLGMDEMPVQLLERIELHATGLFFTDPHESSRDDLALWEGINSDALCVVFLGHSCPDPDTCAGHITAPATCVSTGARHLLACCFHQVGTTPIRPTFAADAQVDVTSTVVCSFEMQSDDLPEGASWTDLAQGPVRAVHSAFASTGVSKAITSPWGRSYRAKGRASTPLLCDSFLFRAKVPAALLPGLLQKSGYNHVYVVPRTVENRPLPGWRIIWLTATRAEAVRQAALLPSQHGLVRSRNKFGVRVPSQNFAEAFQKLKPTDTVPIDIEVRELYKLGPVHIGATSDKIAAWATALKWPVRVLRSLGPAHWLLGAASPPPTECPCLNGTPVLVTKLPGRSQQAPVVISHGPIQRPPAAKQVQQHNLDADPWDTQDPWSQYRGNPPKVESKAASSSSNPPTRQPDAASSARLQALEHGLATLQAQRQQSVKDRELEKQQVASEFRNIRGDMQSMHTNLSSQVQASLESFRAAQLQQEQQVKAGMDELKMLLLQSNADKKPRKDHSHE